MAIRGRVRKDVPYALKGFEKVAGTFNFTPVKPSPPRSLLLFLCIFSGFLLGVSFPGTGSLTPLAFVALLPFLYVEDRIANSRHQGDGTFFLCAFLGFLTYNLYTTWWILYATVMGMVMAVVANALLMTLVAQAFHYTKRSLGGQRGMAGLLFFWPAFEWVHYNWDLAWPWLNFGNIFAARPTWVQWYEYTGVLGGTVWILLLNILIWVLVKRALVDRTASVVATVARGVMIIGVIVVPLWVSYDIGSDYEEKGEPVDLLLLQPNIDPYKEKFPRGEAFIPYDEQFQRLVDAARANRGAGTDLIIGPETALPGGYWEGALPSSEAFNALRKLTQRSPQPDFIVGLSSYRNYGSSAEKPTPTARRLEESGEYYDAFNTALKVGPGEDSLELYHKSRLVLGVEKLPFPWLLAPVEEIFDLGGTTGSLGVQEEPTVFDHGQVGNAPLKTAPLICYESIFGAYVTEFTNRGANLLVNITNDGWWSDTPGYQQHLALGRLRAIETRRPIARSANTGISCLIDQRGRIEARTQWWKKSTLKGRVKRNDEVTFYMRYGDSLGRIAAFVSFFLLVFAFTKRIRDKKDLQVR